MIPQKKQIKHTVQCDQKPGVPEQQDASRKAASPRNDRLLLTRIVLDTTLQCRTTLDKATVESYAGHMLAGQIFPPLTVFEMGGAYFLVDGRHRYKAALQTEQTEFAVEVHQGSRDEALRFALQANTTHGLLRSNRAKRRAVRIALRLCVGDSDRVIYACCAASIWIRRQTPKRKRYTSVVSPQRSRRRH